MATVGAILGLASSLLGAVGGVAGAAKGPGGSPLAPGASKGGFSYRPTALGQPQQVNIPGMDDQQMRLSEMLRLAG